METIGKVETLNPKPYKGHPAEVLGICGVVLIYALLAMDAQRVKQPGPGKTHNA